MSDDLKKDRMHKDFEHPVEKSDQNKQEPKTSGPRGAAIEARLAKKPTK